MNENQKPNSEDTPIDEPTPLGAITVTTILAITILVFWFGVYMLNISRS